MKLIGKNSLAKAVSTFSLVIFIIMLYNTIYSIFGFSVCYYNYKTGNHFLENKFMVGQTVGYNLPPKDFIKPKDIGKIRYRFNNLFSDGLADTGLFDIKTFISSLLQGIFYSVYFLLISKIFKFLSREKLFSSQVIKYLKYFAYLNIIYIPIAYLQGIYIYDLNYSNALARTVSQMILGGGVLFALAVFKKGYELQSENELTI